MSKKSYRTLSLFLALFLMSINECQAVNLFQEMAKLARLTLGNGLTEIPAASANLRHHGTRFSEAVLDLANYVSRFGEEGTMRGIRGTALSRRIQESKDDWDSHLSHSSRHVQDTAKNADEKIQTTYRHYVRTLDDWSENP